MSSETHFIEHLESVFKVSFAECHHALIKPGSEGHDLWALLVVSALSIHVTIPAHYSHR